MKHIPSVLIFLIVILCSCQERDKKGKVLNTPTSGMLRIAADESLKPIVEAEIKTFESLYQNAHIHVDYVSEEVAIKALLDDSVSLVWTTRKLATDERKYFETVKIEPAEIVVAKDGIALILNKANEDSVMHVDVFTRIIKGEITDWKQLDEKVKSSAVQVVFDNPKSGMIRLLNDSVTPIEKTPANFFAVQSNEEVINYVTQKQNAIGLIGVSWISGKDSSANSFLKTVRVVSLGKTEEVYKPFQAYLALGYYPLQRDVIMISREARAGLASGFMSFVASDRGQRIILKLGIVPVTMPLRIVDINHEPLNLP